MNTGKIVQAYVPMTETAFYILLSLAEPRHGYGIIKHVEDITSGRIRLGSGTVYGTLTRMHRDQVITVFSDERRKTIYEMTPLGRKLISVEINRLRELYCNAVKFEAMLCDS